MTPYHSRLWAEQLTLQRAGGSIDHISAAIANARVDLNPHQVDAALFAFRSPLTKGVILADEVGLGKTIEAGLVLSQRWAERRRRILLIVPATLRKQWQQELASKFFLPSVVVDSRSFNQMQEKGHPNPLERTDYVVITSYQFAAAKHEAVAGVPWDLVVIDEAHRLRNVFNPRNKTANRISAAIRQRPKLLLTATPLQNSLLELYGLASIVDEHVFGDIEAFREQFVRASNETERNKELRGRLASVCIRTLRRQVLEYVPFTNRIPLTADFRPSSAERDLYDQVSEYLQRETLYALPNAQRALITLVLRKLLASSSFAIAKTLNRLAIRLEKLASENAITTDDLFDDEDLEGIDEIEDEFAIVAADAELDENAIDPKLLMAELADVRKFADMAGRITTNAKGEALIPALNTALAKAVELGAQRKAVIFTESRRTQEYLFDLLNQQGYAGQVVMMNGSNSDAASKAIYAEWCKQHENDGQVTGSRPVDIKAAIVEHFKDHAIILLATEAAAEGVNLQFASLVVNYDLPWNPQRVEQRIGRCHRYGQKHDVVVLNFVNRMNAADQRVHDLLGQKFRLFDGVFGASDEILGALESGVDVERRIAQVYQECRTPDEITAAFDKLQSELDEEIKARMAQTRQALLENFDEEVGARLRVHRDKTLESLNQRERWLLEITRAELNGDAKFDQHDPRFTYTGNLSKPGTYNLNWKEAEQRGEHFYRPDHELAQRVVQQALARQLEPAQLTFNYSAYGGNISLLDPLVGKSGWLEISKLTIESLDTEQFLIFAGQTDDGQRLDEETCQKLMQVPATVSKLDQPEVNLDAIRDGGLQAKLREVEERNAKFFDEEVNKLDRWTEDLKRGLEAEIKELDRLIREQKKSATLMVTLAEKLEAQKQIKELEANRSRKRRELFDAQDQIDAKRDEMIKQVEARLKHRQSQANVATIRWMVD
ncbi:MAG: DEAD/DEAH box helicase family protein [Planctomycetes bacterium]|nr:DEAD/DEAH box helicase family protein [Planctomycetota bacterium]MCW8134472.1 DEAD/DEAH box helicase family protein [Planctomycetota bacterium]